MVDVCNPQNHTNIKFLFYILPVIHFVSPRQTENQITARNAVVLFHSFFFFSLLTKTHTIRTVVRFSENSTKQLLSTAFLSN